MPDRIDFLNKPEVNFFGAFYPVGYAVLAFRDSADALAVKQYWADAGYEDADATIVLAHELATAEGGNEAGVDGVAEALDGETKLMHKHQKLARDGATFLMVYAPDDETTTRLSSILKRFVPLSADKYDRLTISGL